ncbi:hypothetical protein [Pseudoroseicyclus sp. CXY001]|uniref:hypothetical protein n=1 Tax=Pseudoroseicyclus sp. CXY001 TaxID=3242492 RepID=UPI003571349C
MAYKDKSDSPSEEALAGRLSFHEAVEIAELSYRGLDIATSAEANALFDALERRLAETGEALWFFLLDQRDYRVEPSAWMAFARRGSDLRAAHAQGLARWDDSAITARQIARTAGTDLADPTLFASREAAWAHLRSLPSKRRHRIEHVPNLRPEDIRARITTDPGEGLMEVDLSGLTFAHSRDVADVFNEIEAQIRASGHKWWMLMNYERTRIEPPAWVAYTLRSDELRERYVMGAVRYAPDAETEADIRRRAESRARPNIRNSRAEALERLDEMIAAYAAAH